MESAQPEREVVVLDTSVLINFLAVDRMDLFARHPRYCFCVTEHVRGEVTRDHADQVTRLDTAVKSAAVTELRVDDINELGLFARLSANPQLGVGECAAIAVAAHRNCVLAIDDTVARKAAVHTKPGMSIIDTQAFMVSCIRSGILGVEEADAIKADWASKHRFALKIHSFRDLLDGT